LSRIRSPVTLAFELREDGAIERAAPRGGGVERWVTLELTRYSVDVLGELKKEPRPRTHPPYRAGIPGRVIEAGALGEPD